MNNHDIVEDNSNSKLSGVLVTLDVKQISYQNRSEINGFTTDDFEQPSNEPKLDFEGDQIETSSFALNDTIDDTIESPVKCSIFGIPLETILLPIFFCFYFLLYWWNIYECKCCPEAGEDKNKLNDFEKKVLEMAKKKVNLGVHIPKVKKGWTCTYKEGLCQERSTGDTFKRALLSPRFTCAKFLFQLSLELPFYFVLVAICWPCATIISFIGRKFNKDLKFLNWFRGFKLGCIFAYFQLNFKWLKYLANRNCVMRSRKREEKIGAEKLVDEVEANGSF